MTLHLCLSCATVYDVEPPIKPLCPRCGKLLELRREEDDRVATIAEVASWALFGLPEHRRLKPNLNR